MSEPKVCSVCKKEEPEIRVRKHRTSCTSCEYKKYSAKTKEWNKNNPDKRKAIANRWARKNAEKQNISCQKRRALKHNASPEWLTEKDWEVIKLKYELAHAKSNLCGEKFHVDHIVPLQHPLVCGLNVPWNLRVITATANLKKSNRLLNKKEEFLSWFSNQKRTL